jgi:opacity protein-like surface antigen
MMRKSLVLAAGGAFLTMPLASSAFAQSPWYVSGSIGAYLPGDMTRSVTIHEGGETASGTSTATYNTGPVFNLAGGYRLPLGFRVEGELGYAQFDSDTISPQSPRFANLNGSKLSRISGGGHERYTATVNAFYDLPLGGRFIPYIGAGLGVSQNDNADGAFRLGESGVFTAQGTDSTSGLVLAEVGFAINVSENWAVVPAYRFEHQFAPDTPGGNANIFKLGVRYTF